MFHVKRGRGSRGRQGRSRFDLPAWLPQSSTNGPSASVRETSSIGSLSVRRDPRTSPIEPTARFENARSPLIRPARGQSWTTDDRREGIWWLPDLIQATVLEHPASMRRILVVRALLDSRRRRRGGETFTLRRACVLADPPPTPFAGRGGGVTHPGSAVRVLWMPQMSPPPMTTGPAERDQQTGTVRVRSVSTDVLLVFHVKHPPVWLSLQRGPYSVRCVFAHRSGGHDRTRCC